MSEPVLLDYQNGVTRDESMQQDFGEQAMQQDDPAPETSETQATSELSAEEKIRQAEQEANALKEANAQAGLATRINDPNGAEKAAAQAELDARSIYIGNVDYGLTPVEVQQHFAPCGIVERVTIQTNKATGQPKGFAYLEFENPESAHKAVAMLDGSEFRGRQLKVSLKRTNVPMFIRGPRGRGMRGRGFRGRGRGFRGGYRGQRYNPY